MAGERPSRETENPFHLKRRNIAMRMSFFRNCLVGEQSIPKCASQEFKPGVWKHAMKYFELLRVKKRA